MASRVVKLLLVAVLVCLGGTAVILLGSRILLGSVLREPSSLDAQIEAPTQVVMNEPFTVTLQLTNLMTASQTLHSIDVNNQYLQNIRLQNSHPTYDEIRMLPVAQFTSYVFREEISGGRQTKVELHFVAEQIGEFSGVLDVCLEDGTLCLALPLETVVSEK